MKFEYKVIIMSICLSFIFMGLFTYTCSLTQKTYYVYQVGIYKEEVNKENKLQELKNQGVEGYCYIKDNQYYVLSMISENKEEVEEHANEVKGIMKTYQVNFDTTKEQLLEYLAKSDIS